MKKYIFLIFICSSSVLGFSQSFQVADTDTIFYGLHTDVEFGGHINLINGSGSNLALKWKRTENNIPTDWKTSICDPGSCEPPEVDSSTFTLPSIGLSNFINIHFYPYNVEGIGTTKVRVENRNDASNFYVLSFVGDARTTTGIGDEDRVSTISMYPNPTNGVLNIRTSSSETLAVTIYNAMGQMIKTYQGYGNISKDLSFLDKGIYLVHVNNGTNNFTEKLLIK